MRTIGGLRATAMAMLGALLSVPAAFAADIREAGYGPVFDHYRPSYAVLNPDGTEVKFQFSTKVRLAPCCARFVPYFAYTQKSFWDIGAESSPFTENNYNPEVFLASREKGWRPGWHLSAWQAGLFEHESNGLAGTGISHTWDRFYLSGTLGYGRRTLPVVGKWAPEVRYKAYFKAQNRFEATLKVWTAYHLQDNPDLLNYYGRGELTLRGTFGRSQLSVSGRKGIATTKGAVQVDYIQGIRGVEIFFYTQLWVGYGERLLEYNRDHTVLRLGIMFTR